MPDEKPTTDHVARAEKLVHASPDAVFDALTFSGTDEDIMFGATVTSDWQPGSTVTWAGEWEGKQFEDSGTVVAVERPTRLVVTQETSTAGGETTTHATHTITYTLTPEDDGTRVVLEQDGNDSAEQAEQFAANWQASLDGVATYAERG
ncbi:SRPBCC family protein [Cellulomonas sp. HZM]|uniref:SRPBCC family protein n=1 Tax=Cellulomonas sp. HZM TaxID=1454010 RepID=UPI000493AB2F|nr:SRPBCC family protein [Cellulomonas sp. HZM]